MTNGAMDLLAAADISVISVLSTTDSDGNDISLTSSGGNIGLTGTLDAGVAGDVHLDAQGDITGVTATGDDLTLSAGGFIYLFTTANDLTATASGDIRIRETDDLTLGAVHSGGLLVDLSAGGNLIGGEVSGDELIAVAGGSINLTTAVNRFGGFAGTTLTIVESDDILVDGVSASGGINVTAGMDVVIGFMDAGAATIAVEATLGSINDLQDDQVVDLNAAGGITLTAHDEIGGNPTLGMSIDAFGRLELAAGSTVTANSTGVGDVVLGGLGVLTVTSASTADGAIDLSAAGSLGIGSVVSLTDADTNDITLTSDTGSITVATEVDAGLTAGDVILAAQAGDVSGGLVTADDLNVSTSGAIDLSTTVASVTALSGTSIDIDESDAVTLTSVRSGNGAIVVEAGGSVTAESVVSVTDAEANDISLTSTGGGISIGTEVRATGAGDVILDAQAGDVSGGLVTADDLNVSASGAIDLST
ncbi:MAG: hypothetical protein GY717_10075, partial [Rhodobacteraceae bacterium]|nr:hypothetical protein [Paracoccaceae bacterium]